MVVKTSMLALTFINKCLICNLCKYRGCHILLLHFASMKAITKELKDTHGFLVLCFKSIVFFHVDNGHGREDGAGV